MKKVVLSLVLLTSVVLSVSAQSRFGIQAGIAVANMKMEEDGTETEMDSKIGMTIGVTTDITLSDNFSFRPSINWTQKGAQMEYDLGGTTLKLKNTLNYVELPLNFVYNATAGAGKFFIGAGPAISYGISGQSKAEADGQEEKTDINFGDADDEIKAFEFGGNVLAGYQFANGFNIGVNYNMGFSNLSNADNSELKNSYFGFRIGYLFSSGK